MSNDTPEVQNPALGDLQPTDTDAAKISGGSKPKGGEAPMEETTDVQAGRKH